MRESFENLGIWVPNVRDENDERQNLNASKWGKLEIMGQVEHLELVQFGRVLHDWRPRDKKRNIKHENKE